MVQWQKRMVRLLAVMLAAAMVILIGSSKVSASDANWQDNGDGTYSYLIDGEKVTNAVIQDQDNLNYYGFDWNGNMYSDTSFDMYDENEDVWKYYRAKADGALYVNEWYESDSWNWYYYGEGGVAPSGPATVDGTLYLFDHNGYLNKNAYHHIVGLDIYSSDENGVATYIATLNQNGWTKADNEWYYYENGSPAQGLKTVGGKLYYFYWDGEMAVNTTVEDGNKRYTVDSNGIATLAVTMNPNGWTQFEDYWYYYENGNPAQGLKTVGGKQYYFYWNGQMAVNYYFEIDGKMYAADSTGVVKELKNGWNKMTDGSYYYLENGTVISSQKKKINGVWYAFDWNGKMYTDTETDVYNSNGDWVFVAAKSNGALYTNEWYQNENGFWYYYNADAERVRGLQKIGGSYYYFDDSLYTDTTFSLYDPATSSYAYYRALESGKLATGWYQEYGSWYYYGSDGKAVSGLQTINGKQYIFDDFGQMQTNYAESINGAAYVTDENGVAKKLENNKWTKLGEHYYYAENGAPLKNIVKKIGGTYYGFDGNGWMYDDQYFSSYAPEQSAYSSYYAKKGGALVTNEWYQAEGYWFRSDSTAAGLNGKQTVSGKEYYFQGGQMAALKTVMIDDVPYYADDSGKLTKVAKNGLYFINTYNNPMFFENGNPVKDAWKSVNGKWYYFNPSGYAVSGGVYTINGKRYYFQRDYTMATGWIKANDYTYGANRYYYADQNGVLLTGEQKIGSTWYYFDDYGTTMYGLIEYNGEYYLLNDDGSYVMTIPLKTWKQHPKTKEWYYIPEYGPTSGMLEINGIRYLFSDSKMLKNTTFYGYFADDSGKIVKDGWHQASDGWYYLKDYNTVYGVQTINGKEYYFNPAMVTNAKITFNNEIKTYGADGVLTKTEKRVKSYPDNKWTLDNGTYYYYKNGSPYTGWVGDYYADNGQMVRNRLVGESGAYYYVGSDGKYIKSGWVNLGEYYNSTTYYYAKPGAGGKLACEEWVQLGGKWYYFDAGCFMVTGARVINKKAYIFDASGAMVVEKAAPQNGWIQSGSYWTYYLNGGFVRSGAYEIKGKKYVFDVNGILGAPEYTRGILNESDDFLFTNEGGTLNSSIGWKKIGNYWVYLRGNGTEVGGWLKDGNKQYYFGSTNLATSPGQYDYHYAMKTGYVMINGTLYQFGSNGVLVGKASPSDGWLADGNGNWFYIVNGIPIQSRVYKLSGKEYAFDNDGLLAKSKVVYVNIYNNYRSALTDASGVIIRNGWQKVDGWWYYADATGEILTGTHTINGKTYTLPYK